MSVQNSVTNLGTYEGSEKSSTKHSAFLITINTNVRPVTKEHAQELAHALDDLAVSLFSNEGLEQIVTFIGEFTGDEFNSDSIVSASTQFATEKGSSKQGGRMHLHALLKIDHHSKIRLDPEAIRAFAMDFFWDLDMKYIQNVHVDVQAAGTEDQILAYIQKGSKLF